MAATAQVSSRTRAVPFPAVVVAAFLAFTLPLAATLNLWQDEAYTLNTTGSGLHYAFVQAIGFEQNAPLYFVLLVLWRALNSSIFFLRLFSVLCAAGAVALTPAIARRYLPQIDARWVVAVFAFNPVLVWAALEMRVYALIVLLSALLLLTFYDAFLAPEPSNRAWIAYAICGAVALYAQYYLAFLVAGQGVYLLVARRAVLLRYLAAGAAMLLCFAPMIAVLPAQMQNFRGIYAPESPPRALLTVVSIAMRYLIAADAVPHATFFYAGLLAAGAALALFFRRRFGAMTIAQWALPVSAVTGLALLALGIAATHEHLLNRHAVAFLLPLVLGAFALIAMLREPARRRATIVWSCFVLLFAAVSLVAAYRDLAKPGDWVRVDAFIRERETAGQSIAVFQAENALPFEYYYHGPNRVVAIPRGVNFHRYDVADFVIKSDAQLARTMPRSARGTWLINAGECSSANVQYGCGTLEHYVAAHYRTLLDRSFYGARVRLLLGR